jgi:nucleoside-diphosphate-sugar epimerase
MTKPQNLFCFGLGFSAQAAARRLMSQGWGVAGTTRDATKCEALAALGIDAHRFGAVDRFAGLNEVLAGASALLVSVPPDAKGDPVVRLHGEDLARHAERIPWVGYLSTTGVYGDRDGGWVDETSPCQPTSRRGELRVFAEQQWLELQRQHGLAVHIFRLAGIYGPGRNALKQVAAGRARRIDKPGQVFSRIHVEDIAQIVEASIARPNAGAAYNVCDDLAAPPQDVIAYAASKLGVAPPPLVSFDEAELSDMARSFYSESKRVRNDRIKRELGVDLLYPDYHAGLDALFAAGEGVAQN